MGHQGAEHPEDLAVLLLDDLEEGAGGKEGGEAHAVGLGVEEPLLEDVADDGKVATELIGSEKAGEIGKDGE